MCWDRDANSDVHRNYAMVRMPAANRAIAHQIYQLRQKASLSQAELARRVGTMQSVISRLEDADYEGHSFAMLDRIAGAVERRVEIRFVPPPPVDKGAFEQETLGPATLPGFPSRVWRRQAGFERRYRS